MQAIITTILFELAPLYIFEAYRDWKIISIANCIIYATLALSLGVYCWNRFVRFKFYGAEYQCLRRETKVILKGYVTQNIIRIYLNIIGGVIMLLFYWLLDFNWLALGLITIHNGFILWTRIWEPPVVIYLAGSQQDQFRLCAKLVNPMWPLRVATLLQARDRSWSTWLVSLSDLRSFQSASPKWIETVTKFMNLVRLIIVDARSESEALGAEIETIKRESLQYKTIFVGDETTISLQYLAQLSGDGSIEAQEFLKIEPSRLPSFVIFNFAVARLRPSPDRPLAKFHMTPVTELKRWAGRSLDDFDVRRVSSPRLE